MNEIIEFRIPEENASRFGIRVGTSLGGTVRKIKVSTDNPLYKHIGDLDFWLQENEGRPFFLGWHLQHQYTYQELSSAMLLYLDITAVFEPTGEECGTHYDYSKSCPICGAGRIQGSDLILDIRKIPKKKDIARTIADEWVVNQRLAQLLLDNNITGFELRPVYHKARYQYDSIDPQKLSKGQELIKLADKAGYSYPGWSFWVWVNRPEQSGLYELMIQEYADIEALNNRNIYLQYPKWYQLIITSKPVTIVPPTKFGNHPFDQDEKGRYKCPIGHVQGLNLLSELTILKSVWDGSDFIQTDTLVGVRRGLLVPRPLLIISQRLYRLLKSHKVTGFDVEVVHLQDS